MAQGYRVSQTLGLQAIASSETGLSNRWGCFYSEGDRCVLDPLRDPKVLQCGLNTQTNEALSCLLIPADPHPFLGGGDLPNMELDIHTLLLGYL